MIAAVLIDLKKVKTLENDDFIDPKEFRKTEKASSQESVFPGCNMVVDNDKDAKSSLGNSYRKKRQDRYSVNQEIAGHSQAII